MNNETHKATRRIYKEPTIDEKKKLYELYELIFYNKHFHLTKKRSLITIALGCETWSWRVVGITENAIKAIARNNFNKPTRTLSRDHAKRRVDTYNAIFERKMAFDEWWKWVWDNDKTTLMTNDEHNSGNVSKIYSIDPNCNYFVDTALVGWCQTKAREGMLIKKLCEDNNIVY